jgi:putative serine protease PepD
MLPELIQHGRIVRASIGIYEVIEMESGKGLIIRQLDPEGPAAKAGLQGFRRVVRRSQQGPMVVERTYIDGSQADRVIALNGEPVSTGVDFQDKIYKYRPGDVVALTIIRGGREMDVDVTLGSD